MRLVVQAGAQSGQVYEIAKESLTIGRGANSDIVVNDPAISRVHCEIRREAGSYVVRDLNSVNGTYVNDEQIEMPYTLRAGNVIRLGETTLLVEDGEMAATAEAAAEAEPRGIPWLVVGGIAALIFAVIIIASMVLSNSGSNEPVLKLVPTRTPASVARTTATTAATVQPTAAPSETTTAAPTAVVKVETATPSVTLTASTETTRTYPVPVLSVNLPAPQAKFSTSVPIPFGWIAVDVLGPNEVYLVQVSPSKEFAPMACEIRTRETFATIPGEGVACTSSWQFGQRYYWRVFIVLRDSPAAEPIASTEPGPVNEFTWGP